MNKALVARNLAWKHCLKCRFFAQRSMFGIYEWTGVCRLNGQIILHRLPRTPDSKNERPRYTTTHYSREMERIIKVPPKCPYRLEFLMIQDAEADDKHPNLQGMQILQSLQHLPLS